MYASLSMREQNQHDSVLGRCLLRRPRDALAVLMRSGTRHAYLVTGISVKYFGDRAEGIKLCPAFSLRD